MVALNPQITKSFAAGNYEETHKLIFRGAKFTYFLMLLLMLPICLETKTILHLWLGIVPEYAVVFVRWTLIITLVNSLSNTLITGLHASGNLKRYMTIVGIVEVSNFPLTYIAFKIGLEPVAAYWVFASVYLILMFLRLYLIKDLIYLNGREYIKAVYFRVFPVSLVAAVIPVAICCYFEDSILRFFIVSFISLCCSFLSIYYIGLEKHERNKIMTLIYSKFLHRQIK